MYYRWLDQKEKYLDERNVEAKTAQSFEVGMEYAFSRAAATDEVAELCELSTRAMADNEFYKLPENIIDDYKRTGNILNFSSEVLSDLPINNIVWTRITERRSSNRALVIFHHWGAFSRYDAISNFFARIGLSVFEIALPYHHERGRTDHMDTDLFVSPNLGRTLRSVKQAVCDGRKLISWLKDNGFDEIAVLGISLGSWVAGLVAAHDENVSKAALLLTAGSAADIIWTGRLTVLIRQSLEGKITLTDLRRAWCLIDLEKYADKLARPGLELQFVLAKRDKLVPPELSRELVKALENQDAALNVLRLNCGHQSLGWFPFNLILAFRLKRFFDPK